MAVPGGNAPPPLVRQTSVVASRLWNQKIKHTNPGKFE